ncbi:unnamed protein product [Linum tenue]|uniref:Retrotransposon gag domain-containing protein n=1 Tax=Linum tenue TaxID=586396 RepID=A0AAV0KFI3_9ROSI|nr:unnamed protein product [Linum tenue]
MSSQGSQSVGNPQARPPAQRPVPNYAALRKMGVVDFEGSSNPEVVDAWLVKLTRTLDELRIDNHEDRIAMAVHVLQGTARDWWHTQPESEEELQETRSTQINRRNIAAAQDVLTRVSGPKSFQRNLFKFMHCWWT